MVLLVTAAPLSAQTSSTPPAAPPEGATQTPWYQKIEANGFASASFTYNFNRPFSRENQLRVFDFDDNTFKIDVAELVLQEPASKPGEAGFRVDATAGASVPRVAAGSGLFRDPEGRSQDFDLHQAFVSYVAPIGRGLKLDGGKFITPVGYEVIEGYDGFNDHATHSFLFGYAIPFTHTGLRASYAFSDKTSLLLMLVNGWDAVKDNNRAKSFGAQLGLTPAAGVTLSVGYIGGA
jgi:hypothetical protein